MYTGEISKRNKRAEKLNCECWILLYKASK